MLRPLLITLLILLSSCVLSAQSAEEMYREFRSVPDSARTKVWWFHGENTTTRSGITADLEAFKRAGVGGVVYYDQQHGPGTPDAPPSMSPEWWDHLKFAAREARRLGLTFEINISNGYVCGGPWITPELGMQSIFSADTVISGGERYRGKLPAAARNGARDVAVLAFPVRDDCVGSVGCLSGGFVTDTAVTVPLASFPEPFTARSLSYKSNGYSKAPQSIMNVPCEPQEEFCGDNFMLLPPLGELEVSDDSVTWRKVATLKPCYRMPSLRKSYTISFPAATGRFFRLNLHGWWKDDHPVKAFIGDKPATSELRLTNVTLSAAPRVDRWEGKAAYCSEYPSASDTPHYGPGEVIDRDKIVNLSALVGANGELDWTAPEGSKWRIMRFYYAPTGGKTKHGRKNLLGLECDKLNPRAAEIHWDNYAGAIIDTLSAIGCKPFGVTMDSHEAGAQNWTHDFPELFSQSRGYDIIPWLPAMAGYVVDSSEDTENFLRDVRRTLADGANRRYFATLQRKADEAGVHFTAQAMGNGQSFCSDNLAAKGYVARPQGEFWARMHDGAYDIKEASSAAHLFGRPIASAEAFTDIDYRHTPGSVKDEIDMATAFQVNELVVCASESQPWMAPDSINTGYTRDYALNRKNPMWDHMRGFWNYQARNNFMMRQGEPVVDVLVYAGDDTPMKLLAHRLPLIPEGYDFDVTSTDGLRQPRAARYKILLIEKTAFVRPETEALIDSLRRRGMLVADLRRESSDSVFSLVDPDLGIRSRRSATDRVFFTHRRTDSADIYFLVNHSRDHEFRDTVTLRTPYANAQWWNAIDGKRQNLPTEATSQGRKTFLRLRPGEAGFIVLTDVPTPAMEQYAATPRETACTIPGPWTLTFDSTLGAPANNSLTLDTLTSLTTFEDPDIKYFSGKVTYENSFELNDLPAGKILLRLPGLHGAARVTVNGKDAGLIWCAPWEADITSAVKPCENKLLIEVSTPLVNRLIGDATLPAEERRVKAYTQLYPATAPLTPSGLTGDVEIVMIGPGNE